MRKYPGISSMTECSTPQHTRALSETTHKELETYLKKWGGSLLSMDDSEDSTSKTLPSLPFSFLPFAFLGPSRDREAAAKAMSNVFVSLNANALSLGANCIVMHGNFKIVSPTVRVLVIQEGPEACRYT